MRSRQGGALQAPARRGHAASPHKPAKVLLVNRGLSPMETVVAGPRRRLRRPRATSTSNTAGPLGGSTPGATRSTPAAPPASPKACSATPAVTRWPGREHGLRIYCGNAGETYFSTSDIGWAVGHSYIIYGPLIAGMATIMYEGLPIRAGTPASGGAWSRLQGHGDVQRADGGARPEEARPGLPEEVRPVVFALLPWPVSRWTNPRALDSESSACPSSTITGKPETGWPLPGGQPSRRGAHAVRFACPVCRCLATTCACSTKYFGLELTGADKGVADHPALPAAAGLLQTVWGDGRGALCATGQPVQGPAGLFLFDWGVRDADGYTPSSAVPTTSSTSPATASARARSRRASPATRPWPRWPVVAG